MFISGLLNRAISEATLKMAEAVPAQKTQEARGPRLARIAFSH
jgi:hypothetical protein